MLWKELPQKVRALCYNLEVKGILTVIVIS
jgi:hypothetical protein